MSTWKTIVIYVSGIGLILLGIVGLFVPILQGILFIVIGLTLLSTRSRPAARLLAWLKIRFAHVAEKFKAHHAKNQQTESPK